MIPNGIKFFTANLTHGAMKVEKNPADDNIDFEKELICEFMWYRQFKERELVLVSLSSIEEKTKGQGRIIVYDRELKSELSNFAVIAMNIKELKCPDIKQKDSEITFKDNRVIQRTIE